MRSTGFITRAAKPLRVTIDREATGHTFSLPMSVGGMAQIKQAFIPPLRRVGPPGAAFIIVLPISVVHMLRVITGRLLVALKTSFSSFKTSARSLFFPTGAVDVMPNYTEYRIALCQCAS